MLPFGLTRTMVVPVPCRFLPLLKFETMTSPGLSMPPCGNPCGTNATPYGLISPLAGMVETDMVGLGGRLAMIDPCSSPNAGTELNPINNRVQHRSVIFGLMVPDYKSGVLIYKYLRRLAARIIKC